MTSKKNIIVVIPYDAYPAKMGGKKSSAEFNDLLSKYFNVHVVTTKSAADSYNAEIKVHKILGEGKGRYINPLQFFKLNKLAKQLRANTFIFVQPYFGWLATSLKWFSNKNIIFKSENIEGERWRSMDKWWWPVMKWYEKFSHGQADLNFWITADDQSYALNQYNLNPGNNHVFSYGTFLMQPPGAEKKAVAKQSIRERHAIPDDNKILLFNGTLNYQPNSNALQLILQEILPRLNAQHFQYTLLICGKDLPDFFSGLKEIKNVIYAGFVENIEEYYLGSDVFLNPVNEGGGIKTKLVDALANDLNAVSTKNGAIGVPQEFLQGKLIITENEDFSGFANAVIKISGKTISTPQSFYNYFNYNLIAEKIVAHITTIDNR